MTSFWSRFPSDPEEFREVVRQDPGISITVNHGRKGQPPLPESPPGYRWYDMTDGETAGNWSTYRLWELRPGSPREDK